MSEIHAYDPQVCREYGWAEAVLLRDLFFWTALNARRNRNAHDGRHWYESSCAAYADRFPEFSPSTIRRALNHLADEGLIYARDAKGKFRAKWYTVTDEARRLAAERDWALEPGADVLSPSADAQAGNRREQDSGSRRRRTGAESPRAGMNRRRVRSTSRSIGGYNEESTMNLPPNPPRADAAGQDRDGGGVETATPDPALDEAFAEFWKGLLNANGGKERIRTAFEAAVREGWDPHAIVAAYASYADDFMAGRQPSETRFAMNPVAFLSQRRGLASWARRGARAAARPAETGGVDAAVTERRRGRLRCPKCGGDLTPADERAGLHFCETCDEMHIVKPDASGRVPSAYLRDGAAETDMGETPAPAAGKRQARPATAPCALPEDPGAEAPQPAKTEAPADAPMAEIHGAAPDAAPAEPGAGVESGDAPVPAQSARSGRRRRLPHVRIRRPGPARKPARRVSRRTPVDRAPIVTARHGATRWAGREPP